MSVRTARASEDIVPVTELDRLSERARFVAAVEEGLADADAGRLREHEAVVARMRARFSTKRPR